jgi:hypothetical protein
MTRNKLVVLRHTAVLAALLALTGVRLRGPALTRPFEVDELLTVQYFTWVGVQPSGEHRPLHHIDDYYALGPPGAGQLGMGLYCSLGRWPEPNNHTLNSLLINGALAVGRRDEWSARVPALLGATVLAGGIYFLCGSALGWGWAAPLAATWAWFTPYVVQWGQTARGYSWMLALVVLMLLLAYRAGRTGPSVALGAAGVVLAVLSLMNVVSMAVDWVLPYYLALYFVRPAAPDAGGEPPPGADVAWRRGVLAQGLCVAGIGAIFFISHLPSLYSSARQYGEKVYSAGEFFALTYQTFDELFPGPGTKVFAVVGVCGLVTLVVRRRDRFLAAVVVLLVAVNALHFALTRTFPPARAAGHFVPFVLLGTAYLAEAALRVSASNRAGAPAFGTFVLLTLLAVHGAANQTLVDPVLSRYLELAGRADVDPDAHVYVTIRAGTHYQLGLYGPRGWRRVDAISPGTRLDVLMADHGWDDAGPVPGLGVEWTCRLTHYRGTTGPLADAGAVPSGAWVFWYPEFTRLGVNAADQDAYVRGSGLAVLPQHVRRQVKFDVYDFVHCYIFIPRHEDEGRSLADVVREGVRRFGGRAVVFVPADPGRTVRW